MNEQNKTNEFENMSFEDAIKELEGTIDAYQKRYPDIMVVLTGGDASFFDKKLKNSIFADEDILLKGMYFILKQYANKQI